MSNDYSDLLENCEAVQERLDSLERRMYGVVGKNGGV